MKLLPRVVLISILAVSLSAYAAGRKKINQTIDASDLESVEFQISVAELEIEIYDGDEIQLEVDIEADRSWLSLRRADVDDIELEIRERGDSVRIILEEKNIEQSWRVRLPAKLAVDLEMGVGDIRIEGFSNNLDMEVGVGAIRVETRGVDYRSIHLSAGVGDTSIRGLEYGSDQERSFISSSSYYSGDGELMMEIELGVGDVQVRAR